MWGVTLVHNKATMGNPDTTIFNIWNKRDTWDTKPNTTKPDNNSTIFNIWNERNTWDTKPDNNSAKSNNNTLPRV